MQNRVYYLGVYQKACKLPLVYIKKLFLQIKDKIKNNKNTSEK